jgi:hypothetical protein
MRQKTNALLPVRAQCQWSATWTTYEIIPYMLKCTGGSARRYSPNYLLTCSPAIPGTIFFALVNFTPSSYLNPVHLPCGLLLPTSTTDREFCIHSHSSRPTEQSVRSEALPIFCNICMHFSNDITYANNKSIQLNSICIQLSEHFFSFQVPWLF